MAIGLVWLGHVALVLAIAGCKFDHCPPPIRAGHCAVLRYEGSAVLEQRCAYDGSSWICLGNRCERVGALRIDAEMVTR